MVHESSNRNRRASVYLYPKGGYERRPESPSVGIALSGGGSHGAFSAGILHTAYAKFLHEKRELPKVSIIAGTSTGSLVGGLLTELYGRFRTQDEPELALDDLKRVYTETTQEEVGLLPSTTLGKLYNLICKHGIMDIAPLATTVARYYKHQYFQAAHDGVDPVVYVANVIDMVKGLLVPYFSNDPTVSAFDMKAAIFASCAQPVVMTPAYLHERWSVDGGVREVIPFREPMRHKATHMLAIALNEPHIDAEKEWTKKSESNVLGCIGRGISVMNDQVARSDERLARMSAYINRAKDELRARGVSEADLDAAFDGGPLPIDEKDPYVDDAYNASELREILFFPFEQRHLPDSDVFDEKDLTALFDMGKDLALAHMDQIEKTLFAAGVFLAPR